MSKLSIQTVLGLVRICVSLALVVGRCVAKIADLCDNGKFDDSSEFGNAVNAFMDKYQQFISSLNMLQEVSLAAVSSKPDEHLKTLREVRDKYDETPTSMLCASADDSLKTLYFSSQNEEHAVSPSLPTKNNA